MRMTSRRCWPIAATILALALSSSPASAEQFVAVDVTYTHSPETTKDSHYFVTPSAATPPNWKAPVNYAGGSVYMHFEVYSKPSNEGTQWVICFIGAPSYACTDAGVHTATGVYERSVKLPDIWQYDQVDWSKKITQIPIILKDASGVKIAPENVGAARSALFMPTRLRAVVTIVSAGGTYVPPSSIDAGAIDGGGAGDSTTADGMAGDPLDDATGVSIPDRGPDPTNTDGTTRPLEPVQTVGTMSEAGVEPNEMTTTYESEGVGCSVGHRQPSALFGFVVFFIVALRRRARGHRESGLALLLTCLASHCGADDPAPPASSLGGTAGQAATTTGNGHAGDNVSGSAGGAGAHADVDAVEDAATAVTIPSEVGVGNDATISTLDSSSPAACADPAVVCDDFEAGDLARWTKVETGGTFAIDSMHAYGGKSAVKLTIPANQRGGFLEQKGAPLFPLVNNTVWGRMMVFYESMANGHFDTIRGAPAGGGTPWCNIGGQGKALLFNYYSGNHDCWGTPNPKPPITTNKWMCWEWKYDGSKNEMDLWIDGKPTHSVVGVGGGCVSGGNATWAAPTFGSVRLGEFNAQTDGAQTRMWMDDIAIGTSGRIGCPPAADSPH
jgi:hypothetical protein